MKCIKMGNYLKKSHNLPTIFKVVETPFKKIQKIFFIYFIIRLTLLLNIFWRTKKIIQISNFQKFQITQDYSFSVGTTCYIISVLLINHLFHFHYISLGITSPS